MGLWCHYAEDKGRRGEPWREKQKDEEKQWCHHHSKLGYQSSDQPGSDTSQQDLPHWIYYKQQDDSKTKEEELEATGRPGSRGSPGGFVWSYQQKRQTQEKELMKEHE